MTILNLPGRIAISRPYSGEPSEAGKARRFVAAVLDSTEEIRTPGGHPCRDDAVQLIGELIAESLRHAHACASRPDYTVSVRATGGWTRVALSTQACGCWTAPELTPGRGVHLVDLFTVRWGVSTSRGGVSVWFELGHKDAPVAATPDSPPDRAGAGRVSTDSVRTERIARDPRGR
ncbi:ATP-binding protein [Sphaerimonospora sp. CA-214678]|uniref:ATP-binding protein n=1 Tax=Sphaerimonospora sp. CA-214678 TaxID=3240029 RepID=UPI003D8AABC7